MSLPIKETKFESNILKIEKTKSQIKWCVTEFSIKKMDDNRTANTSLRAPYMARLQKRPTQNHCA